MTKRLALFATFLLLVAAPLRADDAEDAAAKTIENLGGKLIRDDKDPARPVVGVDLSSANAFVMVVALARLHDLPALRALDLSNTPLGDANLKTVAGCKGLKTVDLSNTKVTDSGLKELAELKALRRLDLTGCQAISDDGVAELQKALPDCKISR